MSNKTKAYVYTRDGRTFEMDEFHLSTMRGKSSIEFNDRIEEHNFLFGMEYFLGCEYVTITPKQGLEKNMNYKKMWSLKDSNTDNSNSDQGDLLGMSDSS